MKSLVDLADKEAVYAAMDAAQHIVNETGNGGAVAGTGKTVRQAPVLECVSRRAAPRVDVS